MVFPELPSGSPQALTPFSADQFSGDVLCPFCGEPLEIRVAPSEDGAITEGACASCVTVVEIDW